MGVLGSSIWGYRHLEGVYRIWEIPPFCSSGSDLIRNFWRFSGQQCPQPIHLCLPSRLHRSVVYNSSCGAFQCFFSAWISQFSGRIWRTISLLNWANVSSSNRIVEKNLWNPKFWRFVVPHLGLLVSGGLRPQKAHLWNATIGLQQNFSCKLCRGQLKFCWFLALAPPMLGTSTHT